MTGLRALTRLAARDARRDRWRSVLVVAMVALPVAGLVAVVTGGDTLSATAEESAIGQLGVADADAQPSLGGEEDRRSRDDLIADLTARVPAGTEVEMVSSGEDRLLIDNRSERVRVTDQPFSGSLTEGQVDLLEGTAPVEVGQVALTRHLADRHGVGVGDQVRLETLGQVEVSGIAQRNEVLSAREAFVATATLPEPDLERSRLFLRFPEGVASEGVGPDVIVGQDVVVDGVWLLDDGDPTWYVTTREQYLAQRFSDGERFAFTVAGGLAGVEVALIAGAAFAVSVRRRQRELGLLAAIGGSQRHVRRVVLLTGVVVAVVGAAIGTVLAVVGLFAASPWLDGLADRVTGGPTFDPVWIATCVAIGVAAVVVGAWLPAASVARLPVTVALSGRRPTPVPSRRGLAGGVVVGVLGVVVLLLAVPGRRPTVFLLGCVLVVLGAGWTSPWLLERLGALAPRLPVGLRLAVRDAARYRTRNGPIVTAAMAGLAATITVGSLLGSLAVADARYAESVLAEEYLILEGPPQEAAQVATRLAGELDAQVLPIEHLDAAVDDASVPAWVSAVAGTPELAAELGGDEAVAALAAGNAVLFSSEDVGSIALFGPDPETGEWPEDEDDAVTMTVPATVVRGAAPGGGTWEALNHVLLPDGLGLTSSQGRDEWMSYLLVLDGAVGRSEVAAADAAVADLAPEDVYLRTALRAETALARIAVLTVGVLLGLGLVAVAVALAAAESRSDLRTLTAVGASRRTRRSLAVGRALVLSGLGGVLAVPVGLIPAFVIATYAPNESLPLHVPWITIVMVAIGVPALTCVGAALAARRPPPLARAA